MKTRSFRSFAKINLGLEVVGKLPGGYHELKTLFATVSLHDIIDISDSRAGVSVDCDDASVPGNETNLAHRAAVAIQRLSGRDRGVAIRIHKRLPVGGGLGGGSSNAATVLRALDLMWNLGLGEDGLLEAARSLGADVPYFLFGGPALGLGRGDDIRPLDLPLRVKGLLVPGGGGVSTAAVFRRFASSGRAPGRRSRIDSFLRTVDAKGAHSSLGSLRNDLERAAFEESPELAVAARKVHRVSREAGALHAAMSGSGSSFFLLFEDAASSRAAARALRDAGLPSRPCTFLSRAAFASRFEINDQGPTRLGPSRTRGRI